MLNKKTAGMLLVLLTFVVSTIGPVVIAQDQGGSGLQISPTRSDLSGQPGEQKKFSVIVKNVTQSEITAEAIVNDFSSDNVTGTPQIIVNEKDRTPYSIAGWIGGLANLELKPQESKELKLDLNIPANASPGAYFGAVRFVAIPKGASLNDQERQIALTASVAHLVFVEIPGDVNQQISVEKLIAQRDDREGSFFFNAPNKASITIKNLGNGFSRPFGKVSVSRLGKEVYSYELNNLDTKGIVLPQSSRTFTDGIKGVSMPGLYTLSGNVAYGNGGEVVTYKSSFWYMPLWFILIIVLLIIAVVVGTYALYKKRYGKSPTKKKSTKRRK